MQRVGYLLMAFVISCGALQKDHDNKDKDEGPKVTGKCVLDPDLNIYGCTVDNSNFGFAIRKDTLDRLSGETRVYHGRDFEGEKCLAAFVYFEADSPTYYTNCSKGTHLEFIVGPVQDEKFVVTALSYKISEVLSEGEDRPEDLKEGKIDQITFSIVFESFDPS